MNNEQIVLLTMLPGFGYTDKNLHDKICESGHMTRDNFVESVKKLQLARLAHRKDGKLFKTVR